MSVLSQMRYRFLFGALALVLILTLIQQRTNFHDATALHIGTGSDGTFQSTPKDRSQSSSSTLPIHSDAALTELLHTVSTTSTYFTDYPLPASEFGKMGKRLQVLRDWIEASQRLVHQMTPEDADTLRNRIDQTALSLFPFLRDPSQSSNTSLSHIRQKFKPESKGIVIPTGRKTFRYACHLIGNLRDALGSKLPIEIAYAGDSDLPPNYRNFISELGSDIKTVDVLQVFDDTTLDLQHGGWAIKAFAALGSHYEQTLVLDADAILLQAPETILDRHSGYKSTGALLFHDRLLWQGAFKDRHQWWEKQLEHHTPSQALSKSRVYNEGYAEECDSGLVMLDKSRLSVLLGLLHVCWQNTKEVRDQWTYKMGYGDKESWWLGLELSGAEYTFEDHYGGMLGDLNADKNKVCSFTIAHFDEQDRLLWYNGSLLKNKLKNVTEFDVPTHYMIDGAWEKGATKPDISCMKDAKITETSEEERKILRKSVEKAKDVDARIEEFTSLS
ncbi:MAG: hypothetical protein LQ338_007038 [Usnochroma carphineum]|nr:MAG: hypothetical protein LQ338_007038 [Usnochroma carphineum]